MKKPLVIKVDSRGRLSLGELGGDNDQFLGTVDDEGTVTLIPAETVPRTMPVKARRAGRQPGATASA